MIGEIGTRRIPPFRNRTAAFHAVNQTSARAQDRARILDRMSILWQDVLYALRMLRASRSFAVVAVLTLALGIGANTAILTLINAVFLNRLPVVDPDRLVT